MSPVLFLLAAWLALRLILLARQDSHLRRRGGNIPTGHLRARLHATALGVAAEAALLSWLLAAGGLSWLDAGLPGLPAALLALAARAAIWRAVEVHAVAVADARAGLGGKPNLCRLLGGWAVQGAVTAILLAGLTELLPRHWLMAWLLWSAVELARGPLAGPQPEPTRRLADAALERRLRGLLDRCGLGGCALRVSVGASGRLNARFAGLPGARRIQLSRTLVEALPAEQVAAVVAHEAGHCRLRHLECWLAGKLVLTLAGFAAVPLVFPLVALSPPTLLAAVWLLAGVVGYAPRPLAAWLRRRWEFDADAFAARLAGPEAMAAALVRIEQANLAQPAADPLYAAFTAFHPPLQRRLARLRVEPSSA